MIKTIGKHIITYLLASMFLLSFTGMRLLIHHCLACDTTDVALLGLHAEDAEAMHRDHAEGGTCAIPIDDAEAGTCHIPFDDAEGLSCCDTHDRHSDRGCGDCCQSEIHYLRAEFEVTTDKQEPRLEPVLITLLPSLINTTRFEPEESAKLTKPVTDERPPPRLTGRDFVIYAHHLKIS